MENSSVLDGTSEVISLTDSQHFQSKYVESNYDDCSSTSSLEEIDEYDDIITLRSSQQKNGEENNSTITIKIQDTSCEQDNNISSNSNINQSNNSNQLSVSSASSTKIVRNPITLVDEEYHSSSSLSSYTHTSSVSNENIFAAIKDIEDTMNIFSTLNSSNCNGNELGDQVERPGRKLSISASSIPLPISSQSASTVSPLSLSCSAPSLPGVSQSITTTISSSQEKEIILIQSQPPSNTIDIINNIKSPLTTTTTTKQTTRSKTIFHLSKLRKKHHSQPNNNNSSSNVSGSNESISPSTSTGSNISTSSSSSSSANNNEHDKKDRKDRKKWRLRLSKSHSHDKNLNKQLQEQKEDEKENKEMKIDSDKEIDRVGSNNNENSSPNIIPTTTTTTTTSTNEQSQQPIKPLELEEPKPLTENNNNNNNNISNLPPFLSTSLPNCQSGGLLGINDFDSNCLSMDDEEMPKGGRGRSNAFYMKGAPLINQNNGEFKFSLPKPPSLPNLVQLSIPSILPKESFSILSKPLSIFSKFKSKPLNSSQNSVQNIISSSSNNILAHSNTSSSNQNNSSNSSNNNNSPSTTTTNSNSHINNLINKVVKSNSSRFTIGFADTIGRRPNMEDETVICGTYRGKHDEDYIALFDGHGGTEASYLASVELHKILIEKLKVNNGNPVKSLKDSFTTINQILCEKNIRGGTTAVVALFLGKNGYIANVGDSRAVLCSDGKAIRVSLDHKPNLPKEEERIRKLGGTVITTTNSGGFSTSRVNGQLAVSRALGDGFLQPYVSCEPDIHGPISLDSKSKNQFLIIACDGLWDVMTDEEAVEEVIPLINDPETACIKLREQAYNRGSTDNISVLIIKFSPVQSI